MPLTATAPPPRGGASNTPLFDSVISDSMLQSPSPLARAHSSTTAHLQVGLQNSNSCTLTLLRPGVQHPHATPRHFLLTTIATAAALVTRYFNAHTNIMLLRVSRDHYETLWSSMTLMSSFDRRPCALRVVHLSGTIRSSQKHLLAFQQRALKRMVRDASNPGKFRK